MKIGDALEILETIGSDQWGIVTTAQAQREGISRLQINRLAQKGVLQKDSQGVYFLPSAPMGPSAQIQASWISLDPKHFLSERWEDGPKIVVSHESAAAIHGIGNLIPQADTFSATIRKQTSRTGIKILSNQDIDRDDIANIDGLPVTCVEKTVADLAAQRVERDYLSIIVADALEKEGVGFLSLASRLDEYSAHYAATSGRQLAEEFFLENSSLETNKNIVEQANAIKSKLNQQISPEFRAAMDSIGQAAQNAISPSLASSFAQISSDQEESLRKLIQPIVTRNLQPIMKQLTPQVNLFVTSEELGKALKGMGLGAGVLGAGQLSDALLQSQKINWNQLLPGAFGNHKYKVEAADESDKTSADEDQGQDDSIAETEANDESSEE